MLLMLLNAVSLSAIPVDKHLAAEMISEFMELSSKIDPALPVNATREYVLDKTAATIVDKYAPLAFLETESTRRMIKRQLSPAFVEGGGASLHRVTSAKVLAELEKVSEALSPDEFERNIFSDIGNAIGNVWECMTDDDDCKLKRAVKAYSQTMGDGLTNHLDSIASVPALSGSEAKKELEKSRDDFAKAFKKYKENEDAIFEALAEKYAPAIESIRKWGITAKAVADFFEGLGSCDIWKADTLKTAFLESSVGSIIKGFKDLADGKYQKHWDAISQGIKRITTASEVLKEVEAKANKKMKQYCSDNFDSPGNFLPSDFFDSQKKDCKSKTAVLLETLKETVFLEANKFMKIQSTMLGLSCQAIWNAVKGTNPLVDLISTTLKTLEKRCPKLAEKGNNFGVAMSVGVNVDGSASPIPLPAMVGASAGIELGIGLTASQQFCFTGAAVGLSATVGEVGVGVGAGLVANINFFQDANDFVGTSNSAGFSGGASLALGGGIEAAIGVNFGLRDYIDAGFGLEKLANMEFKDVLAEMMNFNSIGLSVTAGVQAGVSIGIPLSMEFGFGWTPVCIDTEGNACGRKATPSGWSKKQWDGLHMFLKDSASSDLERGARRPGAHHLAAETEALEAALDALSDAIA